MSYLTIKSPDTFRQKFIRLSCLATLMFCFSNAASAAATYTDCGSLVPDISGNVNPTKDCTILNPLDGAENTSLDIINDTADLLTPNGFFGFEDWLDAGKYDTDTGADGLTLLSFTGDNQSGTFAQIGSWTADDYDNIMLVFKDGSNTNLVGYMLDIDGFLSAGIGDYASPFEFPPFFQQDGQSDPYEGTKGISHISVFYREGEGGGGGECVPGSTDPNCINLPEPSQLALLGIGLFGMGAMRKANGFARV